MIKINNQLYFLLFACCVPVRGASRSTICDLQRNSFLFIPNELCDIFLSENQLDVSSLDEEEKENILDCINYLKEKEYGF
ncbi:hypothetical protein ACE193_23385 [Bernardetia sp. OM2101]|uniref:hypothetical protein n=1 Tax=Bernardetia sp. OM2101 TaxID=3344876 RepID=UPI0035CEACAC